jgi:GTP pyrophosphokinase
LERLFVQLKKMSDIINIRRVCEAEDCG